MKGLITKTYDNMANDFIEHMKVYDSTNLRLQDEQDFRRHCISILKESLQSTRWQQKNMMIDQGGAAAAPNRPPEHEG